MDLKTHFERFTILVFFLRNVGCVRKKQGPLGMGYHDSTTCEEFNKFARFNPYSVLDGPWKAFFFWSRNNRRNMEFDFKVPTRENLTNFKNMLEPYTHKEEIVWEKVKLYSYLPHPTLLVENNDRGDYHFYDLPLKDHDHEDFKVVPLKVILKQKGKYIGLMLCESKQAFALARKPDMPRRDEVQDAASEIGFRGRGGKSYLYQGSDWMPVGDAHEEDVYGPGMKFL